MLFSLSKYQFLLLFILTNIILFPIQSTLSASVNRLEEDNHLPLKVSNVIIPAQIAFKNNGTLWILDGSKQNKQPVQITKKGVVDILGWSHDGKWLTYLHRDTEYPYFDNCYLWAVKWDGSQTIQIDTKPIIGDPTWSPTDNIIAYKTEQMKDEDYGEGKIAHIDDGGKVTMHSLYPSCEQVVDLAWSPNGKSLAISLPRKTKKEPLIIDRITLNGVRTNLLTKFYPVVKGESIYVWAASGIKWSPNGQFLAYYLLPNSASLAADKTYIQLLNIPKHETVNLGNGLAYREWLAWSPDSTYLAYIQGNKREATIDKHLYLLDTQKYRYTNISKSGYVDTNPVWSKAIPYDLLFLRGKAVKWENISLAEVLVPGQRIWHFTYEGIDTLTSGSINTADYAPLLSPNERYLLYLNLYKYDEGSIYLKYYPNGEELEFIRGVSGNHGFYGNYLPSWINVYWK